MNKWFKLLVVICIVAVAASCSGNATPTTVSEPTVAEKEVATETSAEEAPAEEATSPESEAVSANEIVVAVDGDFLSMDPSQSTNATDRHLYFNVYDGLLRLGQEGELIGGLAETWEVSDDGTEYTFYLRQGVKFHDGADFNAEVAKWNIERSMRETASQASSLAEVSTVDALDDYTLKITLSEPAPFLWKMAERPGLMISPNAADETGELKDEVAIGTGPFVFVEWMRDDHLTLVKNEAYWEEGKPYIDKVTFRPIPDSNVRVLELKAGNVQLIEKVPPQEFETLDATDGITAIQKAGLGYAYVWLNGEKAPFDKLEVRQAMAYAIDRELVSELATFGTGLPGISPIPPSSWAFNPDYKGFSYDPEKAKELLAEAGLPDGFSFQYIIPPWEEFISSAQVMQQQWAEVGIQAEIVQIELNSLLDKMFNKDYQALYIDFSGRVDPDPNLYVHTGCEGGENWSGVCNEEADKLMLEARSTIDEAVRKDLYFEAVPLVVEQQVSQLYIAYFGNLIGHTDSVDFVYYPDARFRLYDVKINN